MSEAVVSYETDSRGRLSLQKFNLTTVGAGILDRPILLHIKKLLLKNKLHKQHIANRSACNRKEHLAFP